MSESSTKVVKWMSEIVVLRACEELRGNCKHPNVLEDDAPVTHSGNTKDTE
ncbi:hypothetical protein EGR_03703 [Echinococcus granulosus]|uniref:Uncharacterized protein n=1 Tax=Echinococcus granulosus TaxID=6210 RepID=W6UK12_ECHGR|nr:hypothetical protein EGR_03703 [Echinococcus granulosus]EUB61413.1 hypothetical protein EGR_03703 [Echinococcus granulosus]